MSLLMQSRRHLAFLAASLCCLVMSSFSSSSTSKLSCPQSAHAPAFTDTEGCLDPAARQYTWPYLNLWYSHGPTSQDFPDPSGWISTLQVCQLDNLAWCHLQISGGRTRSCMSLMKILNRTEPNTDPWGTPPVPDAHWESEPFSTPSLM